MGNVIVSRDLGEFFRREVTEAKDVLGLKLTQETEFYLVNLLCDYARRDSRFTATPGEEPLALIYKRALEADSAERTRILKRLGDVSLYVAGFFTEFIERTGVDIDYYISMGGNAYGSLSDLFGSQRNGDAFAEVYMQLAVHFTELVDLLAEISDRSRDSDNDGDLLKLYDLWARTGSDRVRKLLLEKGLVPGPKVPTDYLQ